MAEDDEGPILGRMGEDFAKAQATAVPMGYRLLPPELTCVCEKLLILPNGRWCCTPGRHP